MQLAAAARDTGAVHVAQLASADALESAVLLERYFGGSSRITRSVVGGWRSSAPNQLHPWGRASLDRTIDGCVGIACWNAEPAADCGLADAAARVALRLEHAADELGCEVSQFAAAVRARALTLRCEGARAGLLAGAAAADSRSTRSRDAFTERSTAIVPRARLEYLSSLANALHVQAGRLAR